MRIAKHSLARQSFSISPSLHHGKKVRGQNRRKRSESEIWMEFRNIVHIYTICVSFFPFLIAHPQAWRKIFFSAGATFRYFDHVTGHVTFSNFSSCTQVVSPYF
eukprot:sb/3478108/